MAINKENIVFHKDEFYEKYIQGKFSEQEESLFEEHLLTCNYCQDQLRFFENLILEASNLDFANPKQTQNKRLKQLKLYSIAASIILLIGIGFILYQGLGEENIKYTDDSQNTKEPLSKPKDIKQDLVKPENIIRKKEELKKVVVAENFTPMPLYETAINNHVRAEAIELNLPLIGDKVNIGDTLKFSWNYSSGPLTLVIINNKGEIVSETKTDSPYLFKNELVSGLYYWQLENDEESLVTGKFICIE